MLETLITSKTRLRLLVKFFVNEANRAHMRGLAGEFNESTNAIRKELNNLSAAGYLEKKSVGNRVDYRANTQHPLFKSLQQIVRKYLGLDAIVEKVIERMGAVQQVWLIGDYAKGKDSGMIEVLVLGHDLHEEYAEHIARKLEGMIARRIHITLGQPDVELPEKGLLLYDGSDQTPNETHIR